MSDTTTQDVRTWFHMKKQPFSPEISCKDLYLRENMEEVSNKIEFAVQNGFCFMLLGEVGAGKSSMLRYSVEALPKKLYQPICITAGSWSFIELLRELLFAVGQPARTFSQTIMLRSLAESFKVYIDSNKTPVIIIDEASLLNKNVFSQIHILQQLPGVDRVIPMIFCGQKELYEKVMSNPFARPLANRVMEGYILKGMSQQEVREYIQHHIAVAGGSPEIFEDPKSMQTILLSTGGIPRHINSKCLLCLRQAMLAKRHVVIYEDVMAVTQSLNKWGE